MIDSTDTTRITTIERHILEEQYLYPEATGALTNLLYDLALAGKIIGSRITRAGLIDILGRAGMARFAIDAMGAAIAVTAWSSGFPSKLFSCRTPPSASVPTRNASGRPAGACAAAEVVRIPRDRMKVSAFFMAGLALSFFRPGLRLSTSAERSPLPTRTLRPDPRQN